MTQGVRKKQGGMVGSLHVVAHPVPEGPGQQRHAKETENDQVGQHDTVRRVLDEHDGAEECFA